MADSITTSSLFRRIMRTNHLDNFLERNADNLKDEDFCGHLKRLCKERNMVPEQVILRAQIERSYGHQLFNGTRRPSREKVIMLAFGFGLNVEEAQDLLQVAGKSALNARVRRDVAIIFCLKKGLSVMETQEILDGHGMALLGESKRNEE